MIVLVSFTVVMVRLRRRQYKPPNLWTIALNDDHDEVNFSTRMEQMEYVDDKLARTDVPYYDTPPKKTEAA